MRHETDRTHLIREQRRIQHHTARRNPSGRQIRPGANQEPDKETPATVATCKNRSKSNELGAAGIGRLTGNQKGKNRNPKQGARIRNHTRNRYKDSFFFVFFFPNELEQHRRERGVVGDDDDDDSCVIGRIDELISKAGGGGATACLPASPAPVRLRSCPLSLLDGEEEEEIRSLSLPSPSLLRSRPRAHTTHHSRSRARSLSPSLFFQLFLGVLDSARLWPYLVPKSEKFSAL